MCTRKILAAAIAALILLSWGLVAAPSAGQDPAQAPPSAGPGIILVQDCQTYWEDERTISSKIQGRIAKRPVKDGQQVEEGDVLAQLDDREARLEFMRQDKLGKSDLDEQTQYLKLEEYRARFDSSSRLARIQAISLEEHRLARVNLEVNDLLTRKEAEKREIEKIKADQTDLILKEHVIRSPIRGMIKKCFKREMELVTPSDHQMFQIIATDKVWVVGEAEVRDIYKVKVGQKVEVKLVILESGRSQRGASDEKMPPIFSPRPTSTSKSTPDMERQSEPKFELPQEKIKFQGTIVFIEPNVDFNGRTFRVRAEVANQYDPETKLPIMLAGMHATMTISLDKPTADKGGEQKN